MVSIVSGNELGLLSNPLTPRAHPDTGRSGQSDSVYLNSATGNLIVQTRDEYLSSLGIDLALVRTYNAQGQLTDDNGDNWRLGVHRRLYDLLGTVNTAGSTITKEFGDGARVTYTYDTAQDLYVSTEGEGAHDTLSFNASTEQWTWVEGSSRVGETYDSNGRLVATYDSERDVNGEPLNRVTYAYTGDLLTQITDASGQITYLDYAGNHLSQIRVDPASGEQTQILTRYTYDIQNRLTQVIVDLTPHDPVTLQDADSDGRYETVNHQTYVTTYTYDGTSNRIASITQGDGSSISFTYELVNGAYRVSTYTDGEGRVTTLSYTVTAEGAIQTDLTDPLGLTTTYLTDSAGRLTELLSPAVNGVRLETRYQYDSAGNLAQITDANGNVTVMEYDAAGNLTLTRDSLGNTVTRTYGNTNQLQTETVYLTPDPDGAGSLPAEQPLTTRYVYDGEEHLRFVVAPDGSVTEHRYAGNGNRTSTLRYSTGRYDLTGLSPQDPLSESELQSWAAAQNLTARQRSDYAYDFRGNLSAVTAFGQTDTAGVGVPSTAAVTRYVYDQRGRLLQTIDARGEPTADPNDYLTTYTYDGLGRLLATTQWASATQTRSTISTYDDTSRRVTTTLANGLATTSVYDRAGWLLSTSQTDTGQTLGTTFYLYDAAGRLRVIVDPLGNTTDYLYDEAGRRTATIDATASLSETVYDDAGNVIHTLRYASAVDPTARAGLRDANGAPVNNATVASVRPALNGSDRASQRIYDSANRLVLTLDAHDLDPTQGYVTQRFYDGAGRLSDVIAYSNPISLIGLSLNPAPADITARIQANSASDRHSRSFYDEAGNLIGTLDAEGYLCEYNYDAAGRLVHTLHSNNPAGANLRTSGSFSELQANAGTHADDQHRYHFYNGKGQTIATLDAEGYLTEYAYDLAGNQTQAVRYATRANPYTGTQTLAELHPGANANDRLTLTEYNGANQITQVTTNPSGTVTRYSYDNVGNLIQTDKAWNTQELRTTRARYDAKGQVLQELGGEGGRELDALLSGTTQVTDTANPDVLSNTITVDPYYTVQSGDTWSAITQTVYGTSDANAVSALQSALGNPALSAGTRLTVPQTLTYSTGDSTSATANNAVLSTIQTYSLDTDALTEPSIADPAPQIPTTYQSAYYDNAGRIVGVVDEAGTLISYVYDDTGRIVRERRHVDSAVPPRWSQSFAADASGLSELPTGYMTVQAGRLVVTTQDSADWEWPGVWGERLHPFSDGVIFRSEVTTGPSSAGRYLVIGTESDSDLGEYRRHAAYFDGDGIFVSYYDAGWQDEWLGDARHNTTYVVEVLTHATGTTLYIYEKGQDRSSGFIDQRSYTDWGVVQTFIEAFGEPGAANATIYVDNVSEATVAGALIGDVIAPENGADQLRQYAYDDAGRVIAVLGPDGVLTAYQYDAAGEVASTRTYAQAPSAPRWSQAFAIDAFGLSELPPGYMSVQDGRLVVTIQDSADWEWPGVWGNRLHPFSDGVIFRSEVTTGPSSAGRYLMMGTESDADFGAYRRHAAYFDDSGNVLASFYDGGWNTALLGTVADNTTYVVEVVTEPTGTTLYVYQKGQDRSSGFIDQRSYTDWGVVQTFIEAFGEPGVANATMYVDNISEATVAGELHGRWIASPSAADVTVDAGGEPYYAIQSGDTWASIASALYGTSNLAEELQAALGNPALTPGGQLTSLPATLDDTVDPYYTVQSGDTWESITQAVYGTSDVNAADALQTALGNPALTAGARLTVPQTLTYSTTTTTTANANNSVLSTTETVPHHYTVQSADTWVSITQTVYGTSDANAISALQAALGNPTLTAGLHLNVPPAIIYSRATGPTQAEIDGLWHTEGIRRTYDLSGRRISTTDPNGHRTLFYYDGTGRLTHTVNASGEVEERIYNTFGELQDRIRYTNRISTTGLTGGAITSDLLNRLAQVARPAGENADSRTRTNYTLRGAVREAIQGYGSGLESTTRYTYNAFGDIAGKDTQLNATAFRLDAYQYDRRGLLTQTTEDLGGINRITTKTYDAFGRITQTTDGNGIVRTYAYDRLGRQIATTTDPGTGRLNVTTVTTYDAFARVLTQTDARGNDTTYSYDDANRRFTITTPEGIRTVTRANRHGETVEIEVQEGTQPLTLTRYQYDRNGSLTGETEDPSGLNLSTAHTYDRANRRILTRDANGTYTRFDYDAANRISTRIVDPRTINTENDNPNGLNLTTTYRYDGQGRTLTVTEGVGDQTTGPRVTKTFYNAKGEVTEVIVDPTTINDPNDNPSGLNLRTTYTYDARGKTLTVTEGAGTSEARTERYDYDNLGRRTLHVKDDGGLNIRCVYVYDQNDNLIRKTEAEGSTDVRTTRYVHDANNRLVFTINALRYVTEHAYEANGNRIATLQYGSALTSTVLDQVDADPSDALTTVRDNLTTANSEERGEIYVYDDDNRQRYTIDAAGYITETIYDEAGRTRETIAYADALNSATILLAAGYTPEQVQGMTGDERREALMAVLNVNTVSDGISVDAVRDQWVVNTYDRAGRLETLTDPAGIVTQYFYEDDRSQATRIVEAAGTLQARETRRIYDRAGRLTEETIAYGRPEAITQRFGYDALGNQTTLIDPRGVDVAEGNSAWAQAERVRLRYSADASQLTDLQRADLLRRYTSTQTFDKLGRKTSATDALGNVTQTAYDARGNIIKVTDPRGFAGYFYYDARDKVRFQVDPMGYVTAYDYDAFGNLTEEIRYADPLTGSYDENTALADIAQRAATGADPANDRRTTKAYDDRNLVTDIVYEGNGVNYTERFEYDAFGDKIQYKDKNDAIFNYEYNARGELVQELSPQVDVVTAVLPSVVTQSVRLTNIYAYDAFGNRTLVREAVGLPQERQTTITYDALNRETRTEGPAFSVFDRTTGTSTTQTPITLKTYDGAGNLVEEIGPGENRTLHYYDALNRKIASVDADNVLREYEYDSVGNLIRERTYATRLASPLTWQQRPVPVNPNDYREMRYQYNANNLRTGTETRVETLFSYDLLQNTGQGYYDSAVLTVAEYNANGDVVKTVEGRAVSSDGFILSEGNATYQYYDAKGNRILQVDPLGYVIQWEYNSQGEVERETKYATALPATVFTGISTGSDPQALVAALPPSPADRITEYDYDRLGRVIAERKLAVDYATVAANTGVLTEQTGNVETRYEYDGNGNRTAQILPGAHGRIDFSYDVLGRQTVVLNPEFQAFNGRGQPLVTTREETRFAYDAHGNLAVETQLGLTTSENQEGRFAYDSAGNLRTEVSPEGATITHDYDVRGNVIRTSRPVRDVDNVNHTYRTYYTYDGLGRETTRQDIEDEGTPQQQTRETNDVRYNAHGDIEAKGINGQFQEQYRYDRLGRLFWTNSENGTPRLYLYDASGNAVVEIHAIDTDLTTVNGADGPQPVTSPADIRLFSPQDVQYTFSLYDARNRITDVFQPPMEYGDLVSTPPTVTTSGTQGFPDESLSDLTQYQPVDTSQMTSVDTQARSIPETLRTTLSDVPGEPVFGFGKLPLDVPPENIDIPLSELGLQAGTTTVVQPPVVDPATEEVSSDGQTKTITERVTKTTVTTDVAVQADKSVLKKVTTTTDEIRRETVFQRQMTEVQGENEQEEQWVLIKTEEFNVDRTVDVKEERIVRERAHNAVGAYIGSDPLTPRTPPVGTLSFTPPATVRIVHAYWNIILWEGEDLDVTVPAINAFGDGPTRVLVRYSTGEEAFKEIFGAGTLTFLAFGQAGYNMSPITEVKVLKGNNLIVSTSTQSGIPAATKNVATPAFVSVKGQHTNAATVQFRLLNSDGTPATSFMSKTFTSYPAASGEEAVFQSPSYAAGQRYEYIVYDSMGNVLNHVQGRFAGEHLNRYQINPRQVITQKIQLQTDSTTRYNYFQTIESRLQNNYLRRLVLSLSEAAPDEKIIHRSQTYNAFGEIETEIDGNGNRTDLAYDDLGKLIRVEQPQTQVYPEEGAAVSARPTTRYYYDELGQHVATRDPNSHFSGAIYHNTRLLVNGRVAAEFDAFGDDTRYVYDRLGNRRQEISTVDLETEYQHDRNGRLSRVNRYDAQGSLHSYDTYEYDATGNRIAHTNALGDRETYLFDGQGRIRRHTSFAGRQTRYDYSYLATIGGVGGYEKRTITAGTSGDDTLADQIDYFGKLRRHIDLGGHQFDYFYNTAGWLREQTGTTAVTDQRNDQRILYSYYQNGYLSSIDDLGISSYARFQYDRNGNRVLEAYSQVPIGAGDQQTHPYQVASAEYDELNRVRSVLEAGKFDIRYAYDANGNRRSVESTYNNLLNNTSQQQNFYYTYDRMNRFLITMGQRDTADSDQDGNTQEIVRGTTGFEIRYDALGRRAQVFSDHADANGVVRPFREDYTYDPTNTVRETRIHDANGTLVGRALRENDAIGNLRHYREYDDNNVQTKYTYFEYDRDNFTTLELDDTTNFGQRSRTRYNYLGNGILNSTTSDTIDSAGNQVANTATVTLNYAYERWDTYKESSVTISATAENVNDWRPGTSTYRYDSNGHIVRVYDSQADRTLEYINNHHGQVLRRYQIDHDPGGDLPPVIRRFYFLNGIGIGDVGNDDVPSRVDYAQVLADREKTTSRMERGGYRGIQWRREVKETGPAHSEIRDRVFPVTSVDFDQNYQPINDKYPPRTAQSHIVQSGETLQGIARAMWGDATLWYILADTNGLRGDEPLVAGTRLTIPNVVTNIHNNADTFRPYDPGLALGDTTPTLPDPPPPPRGRGGCGRILIIVVAVVASIVVPQLMALEGFWAAVVGAAAGNAAAQGTAMALGYQDKFDWSAVGRSALNAGLTYGVTDYFDLNWTSARTDAAKWGDLAINAMQRNLISQGASMLVGQQEKFSWSSLAAAGISAPLTREIDRKFGSINNNRQHGYVDLSGQRGQPFTWSNFGRSLTGEFLKATTRQAVNILTNRGGKLDWAQVAGDAFGNAVGNSIVADMKHRQALERKREAELNAAKHPDRVFTSEYRRGELMDSTLAGGGSERLKEAIIGAQHASSDEKAAPHLEVIAAERKRPLEEIQAEYKVFKEQQILVKQDIKLSNGRLEPIPELKQDQTDFIGSTWQLRYGKIVGDYLGIDPVFGAMLNPTGGLVGPGSSGVDPGSWLVPDFIADHSVYHDAMGYLYNYHGAGPGYDYLQTSVLPTHWPLTGQFTGALWWLFSTPSRVNQVASVP